VYTTTLIALIGAGAGEDARRLLAMTGPSAVLSLARHVRRRRHAPSGHARVHDAFMDELAKLASDPCMSRQKAMHLHVFLG
jgi:hypothetical protein